MVKATLKSLSDALADRLVHGALPGELAGFGEAEQAEAARFMAAAAGLRPPGTARMALETISGDDSNRQMRLAIANDDMPFLVDSIAATIGAHDIAIDRIIHPVLRVEREADGALAQVGSGNPESMIYIEMERVDARRRRTLLADIERNLDNVRASVSDWDPLQAAMAADAAVLAASDNAIEREGGALLTWFLDRHFTLLGHGQWAANGTPGDMLGIARLDQPVPILADQSRQLALDWFRSGNPAPLIVKSNLISGVHRHVPLDLVIVPIREAGAITGLSIHAGLWTSSALNAPPQDVPVLRARLHALEAKFGFDPKGHTGKALSHALTALPHDLVTAFDPASLETVALTAMSLADRPRPEMVLVRSTLGRHMFGFVWLPRDDLSTVRRIAIGE
ncbi:MAG: glutamate dehydrogenase, partial [Sphingomonas hengshuiensis]